MTVNVSPFVYACRWMSVITF